MHAMFLGMIVALMAEAEVVRVDRDNVQITHSCRVEVVNPLIADTDGNGVIHITGDDLVIEFGINTLRGAGREARSDSFAGTGIVITGNNITLSGVRVSGYKVGIHVKDADGLTIYDCDISGNYRQHLGSTPRAEDSADWLWPHHNDEHEWITNYGAGLYIENSNRVTVRDIHARNGQNGIILDRVNDSKIYDNDCSFLSGWGLAMWRSSGNTITRNAFDFCVRGYSHNVYNRGQDSAGILMFEQCNGNLIAENSVTHGGDGIFAFAGKEALGEVNPRADPEWYRRRGHANNRFLNNDLSYAAAHGLELTFSFDNEIFGNRMVENAICGIWGGYSQGTTIAGNTFERNGDMAYGLERGGINIEHGADNLIAFNAFKANKCGIHLWWDEDAGLMELIWARVNEKGSTDTLIHNNTFTGDTVALHLRQTRNTRIADNSMQDVELKFDLTDSETVDVDVPAAIYETRPYLALGDNRPVGARERLRGRENIIIGEWGPYDWGSPLLQLVSENDAPMGGKSLEYRILGSDSQPELRITSIPPTEIRIKPFPNARTGKADRLKIHLPDTSDHMHLLDIRWRFADEPWQSSRRVVMDANWKVWQFASKVDPRDDVERWRRAARDVTPITYSALDFTYAMNGPKVIDNKDHFGTIAHTRLTFPAGAWRLKSTSDDGIRVWMDNELVIDDWTWHAPKEIIHEFRLEKPATIELRVEHFELDGYAILTVEFEPAR